MTQTAEIYKFEGRRMKADLEDGFYRLANMLSDALCQTSLSDREGRVIRAIERLTFGYNCSFRLVHNDEIALKTGICLTNISKTLKPLIDRRILTRNDNGEIGFNTYVDEWEKSKPTSKKSESTSQNRLEIKSESTLGKVKTDSSDKSESTSPIYKEVKTDLKDNSKDNSKDSPKPKKPAKPDVKTEVLNLELPSFLSFDLWNELVEHRIEIKKPFTLRAATMQIKQLSGWYAKGHDIEGIIQNSISNGYQGLFEPKTAPQSNYQTRQQRVSENNQRVFTDFVNGGHHD